MMFLYTPLPGTKGTKGTLDIGYKGDKNLLDFVASSRSP